MLADCLQERATKYIGCGASERTASIHDASPYTIALRMRDAAFFRLPAVLALTQSMWEGTELHTMQALVDSSVESEDHVPGLSLRQRSSRSSKRHLGRGKVKLMSAAAFRDMHRGAADSGTSSVASDVYSASSSYAEEGGCLGDMLVGDDEQLHTSKVPEASGAAEGHLYDSAGLANFWVTASQDYAVTAAESLSRTFLQAESSVDALAHEVFGGSGSNKQPVPSRSGR
jgi:hypothetical protein